ncbi:MAG: serine/threonine-protein phosphatase [Desulfobacteraceae bacterium]|nr:MAG: serine/threonine-protein phosphatase [Desulfobacteraceae bacterium]
MARLQIAFRTESGNDALTDSDSFFCKDNLFLVAEGIGGDYLGEMAREAAHKGIPSRFFNHLSKERSPGAAMISALKEVNKEMLLERKKIGKKMAASVSVVYISGKIMHFCHLGDSRIYCLQRGEIVQLTRDHTVGEENAYAEMGGRDPRLLRALTDGLGIHENPDIKVKTFALADKDVILMTTEGLTRYLSNMQILKLSMKQNGVKRLAARLLEEAKRKGARDSMTLGIIGFKEFPIPGSRRVATGAAVVVALALLGGYALKPDRKSLQSPEQTAKEAVATPATTVPQPLPSPPAAAKGPAPASKPNARAEEGGRKAPALDQEIRQFLREWKSAWENTAGPEGNIAAYMDCYSEEFNSQGMNKNGWKEEKAERNKKKQWIKVELKGMLIGEPGSDNRVEVRFLQEYKSSNYSVSTNKSLLLKKGNSGWKIVAERAS